MTRLQFQLRIQQIFLWTLFLTLLVTLSWDQVQTDRSFKIQNDRFVLNGREIQLVSGSIHYFRVHPLYWQDRLQRLKSIGLNAIELYVPWNFHEQDPGVFLWDGWQNLTLFLKLAQQQDFLVLLRPGPYICAEWDNGGFPPWLLNPNVTNKDPTKIKFRSLDSTYIFFVERWWSELLARVKPLLYENGGPIVMVQIENEFGFMGPDQPYLRHLQKLARKYLGEKVVLYTTDPPSVAKEGTLPDDSVLTAVDFGPFWYEPNYAFKIAKQFNPPGKSAPICTEFYSGWLTHWHQKMAQTSALKLAMATKDVLQAANSTASLNFYMVHGGTSFGFWAGANYGDTYQPDITSYDYDAIIKEGGGQGGGQGQGQGYREKYISGNIQENQLQYYQQYEQQKNFQKSLDKFSQKQVAVLEKQSVSAQQQQFDKQQSKNYTKYSVVRDVLREVLKLDLPSEMDDPQTKRYGEIQFNKYVALKDVVEKLSSVQGGIFSKNPLNMEQYNHYYGMIAYRTYVENLLLCENQTNSLAFTARDFAIVQVNGRNVGLKWINDDLKSVTFSMDCDDQEMNGTIQIDIIVEAMGRNNFFKSDLSKNLKGIIGSVQLNENIQLLDWTVFPLPLSNNLSSILQSRDKNINKKNDKLNSENITATENLRPIQFQQNYNTTQERNDSILSVPMFFVGSLFIAFDEEPVDTYIEVLNWNKGIIWVNEFNLGRYWTYFGPQFTLYVPKYLLKQGQNEIILLELANISQSLISQFSVLSIAYPMFLEQQQQILVPQFSREEQ